MVKFVLLLKSIKNICAQQDQDGEQYGIYTFYASIPDFYHIRSTTPVRPGGSFRLQRP